jgi:hypothetical protein
MAFIYGALSNTKVFPSYQIIERCRQREIPAEEALIEIYLAGVYVCRG